MTIERFIRRTAQRFRAAHLLVAHLDIMILLEDVLGMDRSKIYAHVDRELTDTQLEQLEALVERRLQHEPLAYIRGQSEFYGRTFKISAHTLQPRPETEFMIDQLLKLWSPECRSIVDVGTGSGAIGITAALELGVTDVDLVDIDPEALKIADQNCKAYELSLKTIKNNLLDGLTKEYDVVLANLPYVPDSHTINKAAMFEPKHAIFGGPDGLDLYRKLFSQLRNTRYVLTESLPPQHENLARIAKVNGYEQLVEDDFIQVFSR